MTNTAKEVESRALAAFLYAVPDSLPAGLIGLGGAKFRLPVMVGLTGEDFAPFGDSKLSCSLDAVRDIG